MARRRAIGDVEQLEERLALSTVHTIAPRHHGAGALDATAHRLSRQTLAAVPAATTSAVEADGSTSTAIPKSVDLRSTVRGLKVLPYEQNFSDCVANAVAAAIDYTIVLSGDASLIKTTRYLPSRLFLYYNARFLGEDRLEQATDPKTHRSIPVTFVADTGSHASDALQSAMDQGVASGVTRPPTFPVSFGYGNDPALARRNPGAANYLSAQSVRITGYTKLDPTEAAMKAALADNKAVLFSMNLPVNFPGSEQDVDFPPSRPGSLPTMKPPTNQRTIGGHEMLAVGYNDDVGAFIILNSWGSTWGKNGYAYLPYSYFDSVGIPKGGSTPKPLISGLYTINGIKVSNTPDPAIGSLSDLVPRTAVDRSQGQININENTASADGIATTFDFYSQAQAPRWVTPLIFSYDTASATYTLTGIGRSFRPLAAGKLGIPFQAIDGSSANMTTNSVFGFYEGDAIASQANNFPISEVVPNSGTIPYSSGAGAASTWITTQNFNSSDLKVGATFSLDTGRANVLLTALNGGRTYSAMMAQ